MWVEETKNGKFKAVERYKDYLTGKTKRVSVMMEKNTAQSRKVAQAALNEKIQQACRTNETNSIRLVDLVEEYRKDQKLTVKKSTYSRNYFACVTLMKILGESTLVNRLTAKYVRQKFLSTGKSADTLNEHLTRFKALIRWGYHNDFVNDVSFLDKIEPFVGTPHKVKIQDKYLEADELKALLSIMDVDLWRLLTEFLALSGIRFGEAAALMKSDVDLKNRTIHVRNNYDYINKEITAPKTKSSVRDVYVQDELLDVCKRIKIHMLRQRILYGYDKSPIFFEYTDGDFLEYYAYNKYLKENAFKITTKKITPHALRHTHASLLLEKGVDIEVISRRLGHENSKITREIYLHVTEKLKEKDNMQIAKVNIL